MRTPLESCLISISFPGIARHMSDLHLAAALPNPADRYSITQKNCIATANVCQQIERDFFPRSAHVGDPHLHPVVRIHPGDFGVEQIHTETMRPSTASRRSAVATATAWPSEIPPSF